MSREFENQVNESLLNDKFLIFYKKYKVLIFCIISLLVSILIFYQFYTYYENKKKQEVFLEYIIAKNELKIGDTKKAIKMFSELSFNKNNTISLLSLSELITMKIPKADIIKIIDDILKKDNLSLYNKELIKIKKAIIIFDEATEEDILLLIDVKKNNFFKNLKLRLLYDFYIKNNKLINAKEIELLFNEK